MEKNYSVGDLLELGIQKYNAKEYDLALQLFSQALEQDPQNVLKWRGNTKRILGDDGALSDLNKADELYPNDVFTLSCCADVKRSMNYDVGTEDFKRAHEVNDAWILTMQGVLKMEEGDDKSALESLNKADELKPNEAFTLSNRGATKHNLGDHKGALEDLNRAYELDPNDAFTLMVRGITKQKLHDFAGSLKDLNGLKLNNAITLLERAKAKIHLGDNRDALEDLKRAYELDPNNADLLKIQGITCQVLDDHEGALQYLNKAVELDPYDVQLLLLRGTTKHKLHQYNEALNDLTRANQLAPNDDLTLTYKGTSHLMLGNYKEALTDLNLADQINPNDSIILSNRGAAKLILGDYHGALDDLNRAHQLDPTDSSTLVNRGSTRQGLADYQGALEDLNRAHHLEPNSASNTLSRALVYVDLNMMHEAYIDFCMHDELEPGNSTLIAEKNRVSEAIRQGVQYEGILILKLLGQGGFGEVHLAEWNGKHVALKRPNNPESDQFVQEAMMLMKFSHKNIVTPFSLCCSKEKDEISLVMEYAAGGSLYDLLHAYKVKLTQEKLLSYANDVASGIAYLHSRNILHRDLKSANVLLFPDLAKIADFGHSRHLNEGSLANTPGGTLFWMAPEMLALEPYTFSADIYSFGVILYEMCTNTALPILEEAKRMKKIADYVADEQLQGLIMQCCKTDPTQRPTIQQCLDRLNQMSK